MERTEIKRWLEERLTGPRGRDDWRRAIEHAWDAWLETRVDLLLPRPELERLIEEAVGTERLAELVHPWASEVLARAVTEMQADRQPIERWVPDVARQKLEAIASRPGMVDPEWIRSMFRERAVEVVLADTLYAAMRDFSTTLPKLLLSLLPTSRFGVLGGAVGLGTKIAEEIERRLEPEIKSFLTVGTKRAMDRAADFTVAHLDDPISREFRKNAVKFALSKSGAFHTRALEPAVLQEVAEVADHIARHVSTRDEAREITRRVLDRVAADFGPLRAKDALERLGITSRPPFDLWAEATWGLVQAAITAPQLKAWIEGLLDELLDEWGRTPG